MRSINNVHNKCHLRRAIKSSAPASSEELHCRTAMKPGQPMFRLEYRPSHLKNRITRRPTPPERLLVMTPKMHTIALVAGISGDNTHLWWLQRRLFCSVYCSCLCYGLDEVFKLKPSITITLWTDAGCLHCFSVDSRLSQDQRIKAQQRILMLQLWLGGQHMSDDDDMLEKTFTMKQDQNPGCINYRTIDRQFSLLFPALDWCTPDQKQETWNTKQQMTDLNLPVIKICMKMMQANCRALA